jgi:hypothetical protein
MGARLFPSWIDGARAALTAAVAARPVTTRWLLAGPGAVLAALATMAVMPLWLPRGAAGVTNLAFPIILAPLVWAVTFFYACLEEDLVRGIAVIGGAVMAQAAVAVLAIMG